MVDFTAVSSLRALQDTSKIKSLKRLFVRPSIALFVGCAAAAAVRRDVLVLKPGTTVLQLYEMLLHPPWSLLGGEYIRAEGRPRAGGPTKPLRKDDVCVAL